MSAPKLRVTESRVLVRNAFTRLPFRFGVVTMEAAPVVLLEVAVEFDNGAWATGIASDFLAYKWFDKRPEKTPADNVYDLLQALRDAIALGYEGVRHKNCKGVYRSLINAGLAAVRNRQVGVNRYFLSAEDLTNLAVVPLQADLAVVSTRGITHVERNGHHYFRGLSHLPRAESMHALNNHPGLYEQTNGSINLRIHDGSLDVRSLQVAGLGVVDLPDLGTGIPEADWRFEMMEQNT